MTGFAFDLASARQYYAEIGFDTLPLLPGTKQAGVNAWQSRSPSDLWKSANPQSNIGIRCGGKSQVAVIDCDDKEQPGTAEKIVRFMSGLGLVQNSYPLVKTASGIGRHVYIRVKNVPSGRQYSLISRNTGAGEFRFGSGAYVVAPPSVSGNDSKYQLIAGDFGKLPDIEFKDLLPILKWEEKYLKKEDATISRHAYRLLKGENIHGYPSRSEAEQALIVSLINTGHDYLNIESLFLQYPGPGKFKELYLQNSKSGLRYLQHSYFQALEWTENNISEGRQIAEEAIEWALNRPWPGRTGTYDREVFLAHAKIAWKCGKVVYAASSRTLAELANISHVAATNATHRLVDSGIIHFEKSAIANLANQYSLSKKLYTSTIHPMRKCKGSFSFDINHEVFCYQGLGKTSKLILMELDAGPKSENELVILTGRVKQTVKKWLKRMSRIVDSNTGEILSLVKREGNIWLIVHPMDLDHIAKILGVAGIQSKRKRTHREDRRIHQDALKAGQE